MPLLNTSRLVSGSPFLSRRETLYYLSILEASGCILISSKFSLTCQQAVGGLFAVLYRHISLLPRSLRKGRPRDVIRLILLPWDLRFKADSSVWTQTVYPTETSILIYHTTWYHIPKDHDTNFSLTAYSPVVTRIYILAALALRNPPSWRLSVFMSCDSEIQYRLFS